MANIIIQKNPWKLDFQATGHTAVAVRVKLADLLWADPDTQADWGGVGEGLDLPHDIICYNPDVYDTTTLNLIATASITDRQKFGIFVMRPTLDRRAEGSDRITFVDTNLSGSYADIFGLGTADDVYPIIDPSAFVYPTDEIFSTNINSQVYNGTDASGDYWTQSATVAVDGSLLTDGAVFLLASPDQTLEASLVGSNLLTFTKIRANTNTTQTAVMTEFVKWATGYEGSGDALNPAQNPFILDAYVEIVLSFFGDYVDSRDFSQSLNKDAQVQHKDFISGRGNFDAFGQEETEVITAEDVPYHSQTPPLINLIEAVNAGYPLVPTKDGDWTQNTGLNPSPSGWIDARVEDAATEIAAGRVPYSNEGNAYHSGRVHSPTIDELWIYLKKITSGRINDDNVIWASGYLGPKSETALYTNTESTLPPSERSISLQSGAKEGDPLNADGTSFINAPEGFMLVLMPELKTAADRIIAGIDVGTDYQTADPTVLQTLGEFAPRSQPYSLRELEALVANTRFNFMSGFNFILFNKVSTGNTSSDDTIDVGTLYQLHKSFIPNTRTVDNEDNASQAKWKAVTDTAASLDTTEYGDSLPEATPGEYNPLTDQSRQDIYLSAEGVWRYIFDHVRLPILDEEF